jgi:hypothetical protein
VTDEPDPGEDEWGDPDDPTTDAPPDEPDTEPDPEPDPEPEPGFATRLCWNCGDPVPRSAADCPSCLTPLAHLVLELDTTPALRATACPGRPLRLGRDPEWAPKTALALSRSPGVSRRHATIGVDPDGTAWLTDGGASGSLNGTWLNGHRLTPAGTRHRLHDRDELALGRRVRGTVRIDPGPSPAQ